MTDHNIIQSVFPVFADKKPGTAFLVGETHKHFLTALHTVKDKKQITIIIDDKTQLKAKIFQQFDNLDVALLEAEKSIDRIPLKLSNSITSNQNFRVYGHPFKADADWYKGSVAGLDPKNASMFEIRLEKEEVIHLGGLSGAPVIDDETGTVIGVFIQHSTKNSTLGKIASANAILDQIHFEDDDALVDVYVVMSETERDADNNNRSTLKNAIDAAISESDIENTAKPIYVYASDLVDSLDTLKEAIKHMCHDEIVVFDATNNEPVVMFLMGIRAVVRRGVTICTIGGNFVIGDAIDFPFNVKEVSFISHSQNQGRTDKTPFDLFKERIEVGIKQVRSKQYLDLPAFDAIRNLPPAERRSIPVSERVLLLCSYSQNYEANNREAVLRGLKQRTQTRFVERILDLSSPRLVSQKTYDALRRTVLTIVDLTEWRANVLYELGVRTAVNDSPRGTICILQNKNKDLIYNLVESPEHIDEYLRNYSNLTSDHPDFDKIKKRYEKSAQQCLKFLELFNYFEYDLAEISIGNTKTFREMKDYHDGRMPAENTSDNELDIIYEIVSHHYDARAESFSRPIFEQLRQEADLLEVDIREGLTTLLYPNNTSLREVSRKAILDRYISAWAYIDLRYNSETIRNDPILASEYQIIGEKVLDLLRNSDQNQQLVAHIRSKIQNISNSISDSVIDFFDRIKLMRDRAKTLRNEKKYNESIKLIDDALQALLEKESNDDGNKMSQIREELSETYGFLGGIYNRKGEYDRAAESYNKGENYDKTTFNSVNRIINLILSDQKLLADKLMIKDIQHVIDRLQNEIKTQRENDFWAFLDLGVLSILISDNDEAAVAYTRFKRLGPPDYAYSTHLRVLEQLYDTLDITTFDKIAGEIQFHNDDLTSKLNTLQEVSTNLTVN